MARPLRVEFADAAYHVMARGNERRVVFRDIRIGVASWRTGTSGETIGSAGGGECPGESAIGARSRRDAAEVYDVES